MIIETIFVIVICYQGYKLSNQQRYLEAIEIELNELQEFCGFPE